MTETVGSSVQATQPLYTHTQTTSSAYMQNAYIIQGTSPAGELIYQSVGYVPQLIGNTINTTDTFQSEINSANQQIGLSDANLIQGINHNNLNFEMEDDSNNWQIPKKKAKKRAIEEADSIEKPRKGNRFSCLRDNSAEDVEKNDERGIKNPPPPPLFIYDVTNFPGMVGKIETILGKQDFTAKTLKQNTVKINMQTPEDYRLLVSKFKQEDVNYHTYQPKQDRSYRVVIRHLHHSFAENDIKEALKQKGFIVRNILNVKHKITKQPLPLHFIDLEPTDNVKDIFNLKYLLYSKIKVEAPHPKKVIPQCIRCQSWGHTRSFCNRPYRCVKCSGNHSSTECDKDPTSSPKCAMCGKDHPSNYKGCTVYQKLYDKKYKTGNNDVHYIPQTNKPQSINAGTTIKPQMSYAQSVSNNANRNAKHTTHGGVNNVTSNIEESSNHNTRFIRIEDENSDLKTTLAAFLNEFKAMFNQLMNQNSTVLNLLTALTSKLIK